MGAGVAGVGDEGANALGAGVIVDKVEEAIVVGAGGNGSRCGGGWC